MQPPVCGSCTPAVFPGVPSNADNFLEFIYSALRPWVQDSAFPNTAFDRHSLYGHSFSGLFVVYALAVRPDMFDTFIAASPALFWNNDYVFNYGGFLKPLKEDAKSLSNTTKPALQISYGHLEQNPVRRRTETEDAFEFRKSILVPIRMKGLTNKLYVELRGSPALRDVDIHEYPFSDHAAVGGAALADGIDYFLDW
jgi:pimeloyl-ACP methyl ester carboxylesterase